MPDSLPRWLLRYTAPLVPRQAHREMAHLFYPRYEDSFCSSPGWKAALPVVHRLSTCRSRTRS